MATNFQINGVDWDDKFIRRDIFTEGGLWIWGFGHRGQLGDNTRDSKSSPVQTIAGSSNWKEVAFGTLHAGGIKTDGTLWTWGMNGFAAAFPFPSDPMGVIGDNTIIHRSSPVQTVAGGTNWRSLSFGTSLSVAIKTDGTLWTWGHNNHGQLGDNTRTHRSSPVQTVAGGTDWKTVSTGFHHVASIKTDGTLWSWGWNGSGRVGDGTVTSRSSPVQVITGGNNWKQVSAGGSHTAAIKTDGTLWLWGLNSYPGTASGQLGDGTVIDRSSPVQTISGGNNWKFVSAGLYHTAAIKTDGTLWLWGFNGFYTDDPAGGGMLGDGTTIHRSSPVQTIAGGTNWKLVSAAYHHTAAIKTDGTLWTWGRNGSGQLGDGTIIHRSSPIQTLSGGTNWKTLVGGAYNVIGIREDFYR